MNATLTVDLTADVAYLRLDDGEVARTCEVSPGVYVDLNEFDVVIGVEVLALDALIPYSELATKFHVRQDHLRVLEQNRPNVTSFVAHQSGTEPLSKGTRNGFLPDAQQAQPRSVGPCGVGDVADPPDLEDGQVRPAGVVAVDDPSSLLATSMVCWATGSQTGRRVRSGWVRGRSR